MMLLGQIARPGHTTGGLFLLIAAAALYTSSRAAASALAQFHPDRAGWRALGHLLPIGMVSLIALVLGLPDVAVGVIFSTSVACLSLVAGSILFLAPPALLPPGRRVGLFVLPCALANLLAGFSGKLGWLPAVLLLLLGIAILGVWREQSGTLEAVTIDADEQGAAPPPRAPAISWLQLALAVALAIIGGWAASRGAESVSNSARLLTGSLLAAGVLGPLLVLPMLGTGSDLAQRGHSGSMLITLLAAPLLNLCLLLPIVSLAGHIVPAARDYFSPPPPAAIEQPATRPTTTPAATMPAYRRPAPVVRGLFGTIQHEAKPLAYPLGVWRVDTVLLVVLGFALLPFAAGRAVPGRSEAMGLLLAYAAYLVAVAWVVTRGV